MSLSGPDRGLSAHAGRIEHKPRLIQQRFDQPGLEQGFIVTGDRDTILMSLNGVRWQVGEKRRRPRRIKLHATKARL
jgi:hypothetical protein